jgi:hypothetical protein
LAFGNAQVGSHASLSETVTNTGGSVVTISQANVSNTAYSISGLALPASVAAGQSIAFTVKFVPSAAGSVSGNLSLVSDAAKDKNRTPETGDAGREVRPASAVGGSVISREKKTGGTVSGVALLSSATKFLDESSNIESFNPASDRCCRQLRAGLSVDYDQPPRPFRQGSTQ